MVTHLTVLPQDIRGTARFYGKAFFMLSDYGKNSRQTPITAKWSEGCVFFTKEFRESRRLIM